MSTEENKELAKRLMECWSQGNVAPLDGMLAPDFILHDPAGPGGWHGDGINNREEYKQYLSSFVAAWQGQFTIDDLIAEGEKVVIRWTYRGTHRGEWRGVSPTSNAVTFTGTATYRIVDGKLVEGWQNVDNLGVVRQLGLYPARGQAR